MPFLKELSVANIPDKSTIVPNRDDILTSTKKILILYQQFDIKTKLAKINIQKWPVYWDIWFIWKHFATWKALLAHFGPLEVRVGMYAMGNTISHTSTFTVHPISKCEISSVSRIQNYISIDEKVAKLNPADKIVQIKLAVAHIK